MLCMLQLDAERPGSVGPATAAKLCGYDSDLLLELIRWNEEQEIAWRQARDDAHAIDEDDEAEVCEIERAHAARTVSVLRRPSAESCSASRKGSQAGDQTDSSRRRVFSSCSCMTIAMPARLSPASSRWPIRRSRSKSSAL